MNEEKYTPNKHYKEVICALSILSPKATMFCEREKCSLWDGFRNCCLLSSLLIDHLISSYKKKKPYSKTHKGDAI